jgi:hypothetical protein
MATLRFKVDDHLLKPGQQVVQVERDGELIATLTDDGNGNMRVISGLLLSCEAETTMPEFLAALFEQPLPKTLRVDFTRPPTANRQSEADFIGSANGSVEAA